MPFGDTPTSLLALWGLWVAQAAWGCWNVAVFASRGRRLARRAQRRTRNEGRYAPRAAVIVPVKGDRHIAAHAAALARQEYPDYRLIFVVESDTDPAYAPLMNLRHTLGRPTQVLVAGTAQRGGQKVHNQLCALGALTQADEAVVFADADAVPHSHWLASLVEPLRRESVGAATGYRWLVPERRSQTRLAKRAEGQEIAAEHDAPAEHSNILKNVGMLHPSCFASVINASIACLMGPPRRNHAWGGSMAVTREMLERAKIAEHWDGALSDDYQLTRAVDRTARKAIHFVPSCLVVSPVRYTWKGLWEFGRRQYIITRIHAPLVWLAGLLITGLYTAGWVSAVVAAARGWYWGLAAWACVFVLDHLRASLRRSAVRQLLGHAVARWLGPVWALERWGTPLWMGLHLLLILSSTLGRRITWAGTRYYLKGRREVEIEGR